MCFVATTVTRAASAEDETSPEVYMVAKDVAGVHRGANVNTAVYAKVSKDAVIKVRLRKRMADCRQGWYERIEGGFICGRHLAPADVQVEKPAAEDDPRLRDGFTSVLLTAKKSEVFKKKSSFARGHSDAVLLRGSVLTVAETVTRRNKQYYRTRQGWFVPVEDCTPLNKEITSLAVDVSRAEGGPGAVVTGRDAKIYESPSLASTVKGTLERWSRITGLSATKGTQKDGFVQLPGGGFVQDSDVSRFRPAPKPRHLEPGERWIAVDLEQQLVTAYEGEKPVRIVPCSTGIRDNTLKGQYTITRKFKQQTMQLRSCRVRVEDVQWVMYYDEEESIAVHSAYWHDDFGTPVSHGCVNLPPDDAKWFFEWTSPKTALTDTVTVPLPRGSGTKVVVF